MNMATPQGPLRVEYDVEQIVSDNGTTLFDLIVDRAANQLVEHLTQSRDDHYGELRSRVQAVRNELLREKLEPVVEKAITSSVQRTNQFGSPVGDPTTLTELVIEEGRKQLTSTAGSSSGMRTSNPTVLDKLIAEEVGRALTKELKAAVEAGKEEILSRVRGEAAKIMSDAVGRIAGA